MGWSTLILSKVLLLLLKALKDNKSRLVEKYVGEFKNDKRHGYGKEFWKATKSIRYDGNWVDGKKCGSISEYNDIGLKMFEGYFKDDMR